MKRILITIVIIILSVLMLSAVYLISTISFTSYKSDRAEGVQSLVVYFKKDYNNFNYTQALENLTMEGYTAIVYEGDNKSWDWCIQVEWPIPNEEYAQKYDVSAFKVTFYGYEPINNTTKSHVVVGVGGCLAFEPAKKEKDKELARQAAEELAKIVGVSLDWERHVYTIAWMTMTSEGTYEEL